MTTVRKIAIGSDHAGFELKQKLKKFLIELGYSVLDKGTNSTDSCDYPDYGHQVAVSVINNESNLGIVICGSGNGINMTVNKHKGIRGALCWTVEIAQLARQHNNANVLALPARFIDENTAKAITKIFLETNFEGGRHQNRIEKIDIKN